MNVLVIGGTGTLGRQIVKEALDQGLKVRCLVRDFRRASFLKDWGAELVYGDLSIPSTLPENFKDIDILIDSSTIRSTNPYTAETIDWKGKLALIQSAKLAQVKRFFYFSMVNASSNNKIPLLNLKLNIEQELKTSGLNYTIFQCSGFFQGLISQYALPILEGETIWLTNSSPALSYIDTQDAAKAILNEVSNPRYEKNLVALVGEKAWNSKDIISLCERLSGKTAKISYIPTPILFILSRFFRFFEFTWNIADRLQFADIVSNEERALNEFQWNINRLSLESYFQEYFGKILKKLRETNYQQSQKSKDISFL